MIKKKREKKKKENWNYTLETNDFSEQMVYPLFILLSEIEPCLPFAVLLAKSALGETLEKCSHIPEKKLDTQKRGRKALERGCTTGVVHLAFLLLLRFQT